MKITPEQAREYFDHPSQRRGSMIAPENLPTRGILYAAKGGICVAFNPGLWPGVIMAHYGVKPQFWGRLDQPARDVLTWFQDTYQPEAIVGWTLESNRAAMAFAKRLGFEEYGRLELPSGTVIKQRWQP